MMYRFLALLLIFTLVACGGSSSQSAPRWTQADIEYKLTAVAGETPTQARVDVYAAALAAAERTCPNTRTQISDYVVRGVQVAEGVGVRVTILDLLRAIPEASSAAPGLDCRDVVAGIIVLMR
jgi:hypothetical protein